MHFQASPDDLKNRNLVFTWQLRFSASEILCNIPNIYYWEISVEYYAELCNSNPMETGGHPVYLQTPTSLLHSLDTLTLNLLDIVTLRKRRTGWERL